LYRDGFFRHRIVAVITIVLILGVFLARPPQTNAQFVIAAWEYPDEHGQGIDFINIYENTTGSWVLVSHPSYGNSIEPDETAIFNWTTSMIMKIRCGVTLNATVTGASSVADGKNFLRHSVVISSAGTIVFSQQNFTYQSGNDLGLYWYDYDCIFEFLPIAGQIYTVIVTYEIFW
jgi:hypothetical protein